MIPKVIHKVFITSDGRKPSLDNLYERDAHTSWLDKNPGYRLEYWSNKKCEDFLKSHFPPGS